MGRLRRFCLVHGRMSTGLDHQILNIDFGVRIADDQLVLFGREIGYHKIAKNRPMGPGPRVL